MEKHLLVGVCADGASSYAVRFIRDFFNSPCDVRVTLFHVAPPKGSWCTGDPRKKGEKLLEETRQWFIDHNFCTKSRVDIKSVHSHGNTARDIVQEGHKGMYDAVILGRQTPSTLEEFFDYSVGSRVIWEEINFPLWFCKCPQDFPKKNVLLCVDEDAPSLRIADHVGFMLNDNPGHNITMVHVHNPGKAGAPSPAHVFEACRENLTVNGVPDDRISELVIEGDNVAKAILKHAAEVHYSVVAVGRGIHDKTAVEKLFPRSVCVKLLQGLEGPALWISK
ncbi:universal stress protein [Maridesulfovibrio sp.]|uniref:universal stress protein n=1 Tax=Maridesulfovibrio sp. TaxID=2795000 RepID=UPI002A18A30B|nr:universal stress protein [Maridesulfovibrio sp.]